MYFLKWCLFLLGMLCAAMASAQDTQFTQLYANRLSLNPAFAGLNHDWSVSVAHRNQWPSLNGSFITNQVAADYSLPQGKSGVAIVLQQDRAGIGGLQKLQASAGYAYHTAITSKIAFSGGFQASIASLRVNHDNLVFGDQLSDNGQVALTSAEANRFEPTTYASITAGGLLFTDQAWLGLTTANLNRPDFGFEEKGKLPIRYTVTAGYKFYMASYETNNRLMEFSISPAVTYTRQGNFSRTDVGLYTKYTPITLGLIYKGVPVAGSANQDGAIAVLAGLQLSQFDLGFSHDVGLSGISKQSGGANEISVTLKGISFGRSSSVNPKNKFNRSIFCPAF